MQFLQFMQLEAELRTGTKVLFFWKKFEKKWQNRNEREKLKGMQVTGRTGSLRVVSKVVEYVNSACPCTQHT